MSESVTVATSSENSQCRDLVTVVSQRPDAGLGLQELIAVHHPVAAAAAHAHVLPAHSAETLARALIAIPIHARVHRSASSDSSLIHAATLVAEAASVLRRSTSITVQTQATLHDMWSDISKLGQEPSVAAMTAVRQQASMMLTCIREVRDGLDAVYVRACKIASELDREIGQTLSAEARRQRWKTAIRIGSIGISVPSFATAAVSAVYNTTNPTTSLVLALVSAGCGTCAAVGPYIAQSCWDGSDRAPHVANLQSVQVETVRMQYPLSLVMQWWRKLDQMLRGLRAASTPGVAKRFYEPMVVHISQYTNEMQSILSAASYHRQTARDGGRGIV